MSGGSGGGGTPVVSTLDFYNRFIASNDNLDAITKNELTNKVKSESAGTLNYTDALSSGDYNYILGQVNAASGASASGTDMYSRRKYREEYLKLKSANPDSSPILLTGNGFGGTTGAGSGSSPGNGLIFSDLQGGGR